MRLLFALLRKCATPSAAACRTALPPRPPPPRPPPPTQQLLFRDRTKLIVDKLFGKYLLWTNTLSCGLLMFAGDAVAQRIETRNEPAEQRTPFDWRRSATMFVVGFTQGPVTHVFYGWLDRRYVEVNRRNVVKKILLDQSIMSPVAIVQFFMTAGLLEGQTLAESVAEVRAKFLTVFMSDCMFWPIAQFINFSFTPAPYRVLYINVLTMLYNVWLSIVKHNDDLEEMLVSASTTPSSSSPDDNKDSHIIVGQLPTPDVAAAAASGKAGV